MTRRVAALLIVGVLLAGCSSQSPAQALHAWTTQSAFASAVTTLRTDARHAVTVLDEPRPSPNLLHTVCGVLSVDAGAADGSLPAPDGTATSLLSTAYSGFAAGAQDCYVASDASRRANAVAVIERAVARLAEARARIASIS
ncbi:MAG: hypothetical protein ACRDV0_06580 [Acidimicrobiales bacterium]